jgi:hypothetical protein
MKIVYPENKNKNFYGITTKTALKIKRVNKKGEVEEQEELEDFAYIAFFVNEVNNRKKENMKNQEKERYLSIFKKDWI